MLRQKLNLPKLNPGSPQQLLEALKAAGIELENTNEETLKAADDGEIIPLIIDYRSAEKLAQQAASLLECVKQDGRIHGRFDPTGTATGRFSSKDPNLQNVGRGELRTCFVPEAGNKLIVADYSQIELRAAAVIAGEKKMIEAYKNGVDLHKQTASEVLNKPLDEVTKQDRQLSKATNFGLLYGQSAPGLVRYAASSYGVQMELDQAEQIRRQFFRTYDRLRQWHGVSHNQADAGAREVRTVLGRRRLIPETASEWERFTALVNTPVQGGCADGMKQALVLLAQRLPIEARLISTVHDEVLVEAPEAMANAVCDLVQATMIEAMAALFPQVPIEVEAGSCSNWGEK
jgi:DNA polymerase I-like protein with 3'-5' exonuclease and polymerase domains